MEKTYGDLDAAYDADGFAAIRSSLAYDKADERASKPNPSKLGIDGDLYSNLASYRASLTYYSRFRTEEAGGSQPGDRINRQQLDRLKAAFLKRYPDFEALTFAASRGAYWDEERAYKNVVLDRAAESVATATHSAQAQGAALLAVLQKPPANFVGWRTFTRIQEAGADNVSRIERAFGAMLQDPGDVAEIAAACAAIIHPLITAGAPEKPAFADVRSLITAALALVRPAEAIAVKTWFMQRLLRFLTNSAPIGTGIMTAVEYREVLDVAERLMAIMRDEWTWAPRDLWDVQGFLWATSDLYMGGLPREDESDAAEGANRIAPAPSAHMRPTNLILYGPPGTGKTYATASRAVQICDGVVPAGGRAAVMERYRELVARKRVAFVTFHQSYAYEDFVEGLRPETGNEAGEGASGGGFTLRPRPGVFLDIADLARANHGRVTAAKALDRARQVFKMSLGRSGQEEGARLFREAIDGGYVMLGWGGEIDWSDEHFRDFSAIKARWQQDHPEATGSDPNMQQIYALRIGMRIGDLVVISDGNKRFRAIGEVTGSYQYEPGYLREYNHRRPVRWLWHSDESLPRELIYGRGFSQVSAYQLDSGQIDWPALEQIISGGGDEAASASEPPEPYVLIIDEINRANVSKVFGELITLLEPDKRLGEENALTVTLPYSGKTFGVPANLHIIGTMNTADRSIALLDTALRRRFEFIELMPEPESLSEASSDTGIDLAAVLNGLNSRIEYLFDREHQIGHAFFIGCRTAGDVDRAMRSKVIPLMTEYFYENWEKVRQVLGETEDNGRFVSRTKLPPPRGGDAYQSDDGRWRYSVNRGVFVSEAYEQLKA